MTIRAAPFVAMYRMAATVPLYCQPNSSDESAAPSLTVARCALQYNCVRWGTSSCRVRAGIAIYEHGSSGRLAAARVDDDVQAPVEVQ
jgi:hypothetical protein